MPMDNNYKININTVSQKAGTNHPEKNNALKKLKAFSEGMSKSDFNHSYTRYSIELKLVDEALGELSESDSKEIMEQLKSRRKVLLDELKSFGVSYN